MRSKVTVVGAGNVGATTAEFDQYLMDTVADSRIEVRGSTSTPNRRCVG